MAPPRKKRQVKVGDLWNVHEEGPVMIADIRDNTRLTPYGEEIGWQFVCYVPNQNVTVDDDPMTGDELEWFYSHAEFIASLDECL